MTLSELIEQLQWLADEAEDDPIVRVAVQPNWPLRERITCVSVQESDPNRDGEAVCWIAVDGVGYSEHPYAPGGAWDGYYEEDEY